MPEAPHHYRALTASKTGVINYMPAAGIHQIVYCASLIVSGIGDTVPVALAPFGGRRVPQRWPSGRPCTAPSSRASVTLMGVPCLSVALVVVLSHAKQPILLPRILTESRATLLDCRKPTPGGWTRPLCCPA